MTDVVTIDVADCIATLTLNRPEKLNAINYEMADHLLSFLDELESDPSVAALIITGAGEKAFSAGADIDQFSKSVAEGPIVAVRDFVRRGQTMTGRLEAFGKPIIAAVNGIAFGGGCEIVEAVHLAVASERAAFGKPEIKLGMPPTFGGTQRLPRLVGRKRALEYLLSGEPFSPQQALTLGLINRVVPHSDLTSAARFLAKQVMSYSPLAIASIITAVTRGINLPIDEGLQVEREQFARIAPTDDLREGLDAWIERRQAIYIGR
jgi:enoyl-CoA hydratase